ncbi:MULTISPECIES: CsbD family protein [unclassified Streptomyces]|uniref:CsbD family protein n=1 Tax=unclassified Streptomyces TaxID=2593676 RepID=UPI001661753D|nr:MULTISPECIES: CsbD family protein [unclassified Streptomyces]MBD0708272.1 general stress protein CsbD [Streptomyces sp. CBMA291]MBD0716511.1 general stress protein CsbD [Streptomyces sp. CBMA370]
MRKSAMDKGKGKVKETVGKATGNERMEAEGQADQVKGKIREIGEKARERARKTRDDLK